MAKQIDTKAVKGVRDFYPDDMRVRNWLFEQWRTVAKAFGYEEYDSCVLESEELYKRKAGDEITEQLYNFKDKGDRAVSLRPEMTPSLARMVMARRNALAMPLRWFSIPQCFRYERMQKGRKREHFQWNMDCIGLASVAAEVELMTAQVTFLRNVGFRADPGACDINIRVSSRAVLQDFLDNLGIGGDDFAKVCIIIDKRDKIGDEATTKLLQEASIDDATCEKIIALMNVRGLDDLEILVGAENSGFQSLKELMQLAVASGIEHAISIDCSVVRGLSYYTGCVWELFDTAGDVPRAIAGGGRYDRLIEQFGGEPLPMVGFGFGDVVIGLLLEDRGLIPEFPARVDDYIYPMAETEFVHANIIAKKLRGEGRAVQVDYSCRRFKHVIKAAENVGASRMFTL
ncbi:MAG: histidine--tRNA ligase, partial [Planctomycetes bacterium]|nr:histidine--tRNA ligase [Planctomycetota bacterium]